MNNNKIPKIIHYCWFGGKDKPDIVKKCIDSWKYVLDDYTIIEWNESNFDLDSNTFVRQAYDDKMFAFVSDYVRVYVLYRYGGIYLDTDVEVIKSFNPLLNNESFWGFEEKNFIATSTIGAKKENILIKKFLDRYEEKKFIFENGNKDTETNVAIVSKMVEEIGVKLDGSFQSVNDIGKFYPQEYFSPYDYINCYIKKSQNTYAIHHFYKSWLPMNIKIKGYIKKVISNIIGGQMVSKIRKILSDN